MEGPEGEQARLDRLLPDVGHQNHRIALPPDEALRRAGFVEDRVPRDKWSVPTDCKRLEKNRKQNGSCRGPCGRCSFDWCPSTLSAKTLDGLAEYLQG